MSSKTTRGALVLIVLLALVALAWFASRPPQASVERSASPSEVDADAPIPFARAPASLAQAPSSDAALASDDAALQRAPQGAVLVRATWGAGADQLGHHRPQEANPEAPMSHIIGPDGTIHVLDQVNRRIQRFSRDGQPLGSTPLSLLGAQDIALTRDGSYVVMDRLADRTIQVLGPDGRERARLPITGEGVERTGNVTGLFVDGNDVLVEREHGPLVRVGDTDGRAADPREEVPGRPTRDGRAWISAGITDGPAGRLYLNAVARPSREHMYTREIRVPLETRALVMLDSDRQGTIYLGALGAPRDPASSATASTDASAPAASERVLLLCIDGATGRTIGQSSLPPNTSVDETFREFTALDEGGVVYMVHGEQGVELRRYDCR
jgi:hypothetical protein